MKTVKLGNVERVIEANMLSKFIAMGYEEIDSKQVEQDDKDKPLEELKANELKAYAKELGITGYSSLNAKELLKVINDKLSEENFDGEDEEEDED